MRFLKQAIAVAAVAGAPLLSEAKTPLSITLEYEVYVSGIYSLESRIDLEMDSSGYSVDVFLAKDGLPAILTPRFEIQSSASGVFGEAKPEPARFRTDYKKEEKHRWAEISFDGGSPEKLAVVPAIDEDDDRDQVTQDHLRSALDPLSALAFMLASVNQTGRCEGVAPIFDGRRLFSMELDEQDGNSRKCVMTLQQEAGFTSEEIEDRDFPESLTFTLDEIYENGPLIPRQIEGLLNQGPAKAKLVKVTLHNGEQIALATSSKRDSSSGSRDR